MDSVCNQGEISENPGYRSEISAEETCSVHKQGHVRASVHEIAVAGQKRHVLVFEMLWYSSSLTCSELVRDVILIFNCERCQATTTTTMSAATAEMTIRVMTKV